MPRTVQQTLTNIPPSFRGYKSKVPVGNNRQLCGESRKGHDAFDKVNIKISESGLEYLLFNYIPYFSALLEEDSLGMKLCSGLF
jgi:hypothetical protein